MTGFRFGLKAQYLFLISVMTVMSAPLRAFAESAHPSEDHSKIKLPQLNAESFPSQIFWMLLCFGILYYVMANRILPQMNDIMEKRTNLISGDLERATHLRAEAEKTKKAYETAMFQAEAQAASFIDESSKQLSEEAHAKIEAASETIHASFDKAAARLSDEKNKVLEEIRASSKDLAEEIVRLLSGKNTKPTARKKG